jgi:hypothetical protein
MNSENELEINVTLGSASFSASGGADRVMAALEKFREIVAGTDFDSEGAEGNQEAAQVKPAMSNQKEPLPVFLDKRTLGDNAARATAIVAWAQKHDGKTGGLRPAEIAENWRSTKMREPGRNLSRDVQKAVKRGMLVREGGSYKVTGFGEGQIGLSD